MPATMKSPAVGVIDAAVGVALLPEVVEVVSMPSMPDTSDTTICPSALPRSVAVTVVDPDVPPDENPTQISAVPLPGRAEAGDLLPGDAPARHGRCLEARAASGGVAEDAAPPGRRRRPRPGAGSPTMTPRS